MVNKAEIRKNILSKIQIISNKSDLNFDENNSLIGKNGLLDSMQLVELCLALEDYSIELGFEFDWTSENALSKSKSMFRSIDQLVAEFINQMNEIK